MKRFSALLVLAFLFCFSIVNSYAWEKLADGIILQLDKENTTDPSVLKLQVCDDNIIRVVASPTETISDRKSLMVAKTDWPNVDFNVTEKDGNIILRTHDISVQVDPKNGHLAFYDSNGKLILAEKPQGNKIITPATVMDEETWHIQQQFQSPADEAFYGLGQHQNNIMNYKGHDVELSQINIVSSVPFLVSSKNYGILWDNNSLTKFGDIQEYQPISSLTLMDKAGNTGGLTAEYYKSPNFTDLYTSRTESRIEHEYIDVNDPYPDGFRRNVASIRWSGKIQAKETGDYIFRLYCSSFTKMWLNGEQVVDSWRQNWLPWTHFPVLHMEAGKSYDIQIDWVPNGGYIGLNYHKKNPAYNDVLSLYSEVADQIDYYFILGSDKDEIISGYREITGRAPMMPKWALGLWQCRERYKTQEELLDVVREFRKRQIPLDNIVQDWNYWRDDDWGSHEFDPLRFPDPDGMIDTLHNELNTHIMISVWPKFYVGLEHYKEFDMHGWLYKRNVEKKERDWIYPGYISTFYDPYSAGARKLFWKQINDHFFSKGIDAWWLDATEPDIHSNLSPQELALRSGPTALGTFARYRNTYSLMNAKGIYEGQIKTAPDKRVFILTRSAYAGQQRYSAATWSGDIVTRWSDLRDQISAGLNFCLSGIPYWTTDIGGFEVEPRFASNVTPENLEEWRELNTRWFQYGTFTPLFRVHGRFPFREMFNIAPDDHIAYQTQFKYDKLRYRLMPYIYSLAGQVTHENGTIMRALVMDFGKDTRVYNIGDQFMFGPALMINPITAYKVRSRQVYLPEGTGWYDFHTGAYYHGGIHITADAPYSDLPIFVRAGSIIPFGPDIQYTGEKKADPICLYVYTGSNGQFTLYEDEGTNNNYEKGKFATIPFTFDQEKGMLVIGERHGAFNGMLKERTFNIVWVTPENSVKVDFDRQSDATVQYSGQAVTVQAN